MKEIELHFEAIKYARKHIVPEVGNDKIDMVKHLQCFALQVIREFDDQKVIKIIIEEPPPKITKEQVDEIYRRPVDPLKPFERLNLLLGWVIQEMSKSIKTL